ncbi:hypothetical protein [Phormidesmis sp. 146-33]
MSRIGAEQREKEVVLLKRFMRLGVLLPIVEVTDEIKVIAEEDTPPEPLTEVEQDASGSGDGATQFSLFDANPGTVASDKVVVFVESDPIVAQVPELLKYQKLPKYQSRSRLRS